ncbi:uncharacterized protein PRD47_004031 [Ara ararauna]
MGQWLCCCGSRDDPGPDQQCVSDQALPEPLLRECVMVTQGHGQRKKRDLFLFRDTLVIAKTKRGSAPRPLLCLALGLLQVLSGGKGSDSNAAEEEEEGKATSSLVFLWPCGSCVVTFCSRVVKEHWVSALLGPPEGVQGARVTQLPSIRQVLKELSGRHAGKALDASSLEKLLQRQAQAGVKQLPVPVPSSSEGGRGHVKAGGTHRRRRRLPWPFAWPGSTAAVGAPGPSGSAGAGALFGRPLADLCGQGGMLPQPIQERQPGQGVPIPSHPIPSRRLLQRGAVSSTYLRACLQPSNSPPLCPQDLLALLNEHGPSTEGIFRLSASERASCEIREALDSRVPVQLENHPVLLLAVLLKGGQEVTGGQPPPAPAFAIPA